VRLCYSLKYIYFCRFGEDGNASAAEVCIICCVIGICGVGSEFLSDCRQFYLFSTPRSNALYEERAATPSDPLEQVWYDLSLVSSNLRLCTAPLLLHEAVWNKLLRTSLLSDSSLRT
jgi:hypothetical protein